MPVICGVCGSECSSENESIKCVGLCQSVFHLACISEENQDSIKTRGAKRDWQCAVCRPVRSTSIASSRSTPATPVTKEFLIQTLEAFKSEMFVELRRNAKEFTEFRTSLDFFSEKIDKSNELMEELKLACNKQKKEMEEIKEENRVLKKSVATLEQRLRNMEQYSRQTNVEINGVPETNGEHMEELLKDVASSIGLELKKERVIAAHRVPTFSRNRTPPIIVKFTTRQDRDDWLQAFKEVRPITADKINRHFNKDKIFINEHLSPENKQLLGRVKEAARSKGYKYVWSREGKIFVRRENGEKCIRIDVSDDLGKL
ncbi:uncharacterized protein LOC124365440 [Homalodisca vitripennis]|uniref:uncharacterized protein LOC124365440 n=1 Tax=Homalodisca vitripennis TaxID=197043 RepID=UPI001EEB7FA0|nr:uncharacterized protein LOC124365440 [Homalodisca vitripennis]